MPRVLYKQMKNWEKYQRNDTYHQKKDIKSLSKINVRKIDLLDNATNQSSKFWREAGKDKWWFRFRVQKEIIKLDSKTKMWS